MQFICIIKHVTNLFGTITENLNKKKGLGETIIHTVKLLTSSFYDYTTDNSLSYLANVQLERDTFSPLMQRNLLSRPTQFGINECSLNHRYLTVDQINNDYLIGNSKHYFATETVYNFNSFFLIDMLLHVFGFMTAK